MTFGLRLRIEDRMEWLDIGLVGVGIAVGITVYHFVIARKPVTLETLTAAAVAFPDKVERVQSAVQIVVNAIEQGRREIAAGNGEQIYTTPDEMANEVIDFVKEVVPQAQGISSKSITSFIKSAVLVASTMTNAIAASKATVKEAEASGIVDPIKLLPPPIVVGSPATMMRKPFVAR